MQVAANKYNGMVNNSAKAQPLINKYPPPHGHSEPSSARQHRLVT